MQCDRLHILVTSLMVMAAAGCSQTTTASAPANPVAAHSAARKDSIRVAGIVLKWITADKERNYERAEPLIREAARQGAEIVVTTECFLDGYAIRDKSMPIERWRALGEEIPDGVYVRRLRQLAGELRIHLAAGLVERVGGVTHNAAILIGPDGQIIGKYRKHDLEHELVRNTPGTGTPVFDTRFGKIALMICADRRNAGLVRQFGDKGAELMLCPSGGMWGPEKNDHYLQARSRENRFPIVFVHPIEFLVTAPDGSILDRRFAGQDMSIGTEQIGSQADARLVAVFDVPLR